MSWGRDVEAKEERKKKSKEEEDEGSPSLTARTRDGVGVFLDWLAQVAVFVALLCENMYGLLRVALSDQTGR